MRVPPPLRWRPGGLGNMMLALTAAAAAVKIEKKVKDLDGHLFRTDLKPVSNSI